MRDHGYFCGKTFSRHDQTTCFFVFRSKRTARVFATETPCGTPASARDGPPKTTLDKIVVAVTTLADPTGSSRQAIVKFLKSEFQLDNANAIKKALKQGVDKGKLTQKGQSFSVPGVEFEVPKDEQVTIVEVRVGEGHLAKRGDDVTVKYRGTLESDGSEFDSASRFDFMLGVGEVIKAGTKRSRV